MIEQLDIGNKTQIAFCRSHIKAVCIKTIDGEHIVIYGSANYRAANCIEQIVIEPCKKLYEFYDNMATDIVEKYKLINKEVQLTDLYKYIESGIESSTKTKTLNI
jgi:hypothetical protein